MELAPLRAFLAIAQEAHMTRAAKSLHLTQPAVSSQLARLEDDLGTPLFHRTPKGMVLTEAGVLFRRYAEEAFLWLDDGRAAVEGLAELTHGSLALGAGATATTYLLPPLLGRFHASYPGIRLFVREQGSQSVVESVLSGELDLGVVTLPVRDRAQLRVERWVEDGLRLLVPAAHRLSQRKTFRWRELDGTSLVLFEAGTAVRELIDHHLALAKIRVETVMELRSIESIKQMVAQGIGAAFVSRFAVARTQRALECADGPLRRDLAIVTRVDRTPSAASKAFLELMREHAPR